MNFQTQKNEQHSRQFDVKQNVIHTTLIIVVSFFTWFFADKVDYSDIKDVVDILKNSSAMIFTLVGIWLAFAYPDVIKALIEKEKIAIIATRKDAKRIENLIGIIITSLFVIIGIVLFFILKTMLSATPFYDEYRVYIKSIAVFTIFLLTYFQVRVMLKLLFINVQFINDLYVQLHRNELDEQD
ncbi:hypothetical protein BBL81_13065 [Vibrio parahaemolyticus]|uniref:hypothetical protein n=1 Tax=Vibrio harveyi group TaxID=717610 RepID=UPI00084B6AFB|nr:MULTISPECIES: hypothetical protein [Vibrio harveyi group]EGQ8513218.1 hypothetical protein [Vibrio parahaemolyticus]EGQ9316529.1 hypothetical protein [Vibrio parahaemolyticus]EIO2344899.1 hypothetical protein [Vibrio parahaemolyticus]EJI1375761.1 hypothetical protein [Vibrio parahaemolyticus]ELX9385407.1 hypothetical protein [Vibrio parahaemolyticus]